jgi:cytochrome oxidase Cu insertion factor (SCO1/SenC/PrrC family)
MMHKNICAGLLAVLLSLRCASAQQIEPGDMPPDFVLQALDGSDVALSDFRGRVVLLNFFGYS